ncbi:hypothetical protein LTR12_000879 [Friedmanniomyces endolithicus]|nr:hypothetical protein LTR12_000879 [Friedmanniomyces endolithicus]
MERRGMPQAQTRYRPLAPPSSSVPGPPSAGASTRDRWERRASDPSTAAREGLRQGPPGERRQRAGSIPETVARWLSDGSYQAHWPPPQSEHDGDLPRASGTFGSQVMEQDAITDRARSFGLETAGLRQAVDHSELTPALLGAVDEHLKHFEDSLSTISESEPGEETVAIPEEPPAQLPQDEDTDYQEFRRRHTRASSLPAPKPSLKSALATSPSHSPPAGDGGGGGREKKKARFRDDSPGTDLSLRRTSTAPAEYCWASSASDLPWCGDEIGDVGGREERAGSEVEGSEEGSEKGFEREDESPSSWVVQVQVQVEISIDDGDTVDEEAENGLLTEAEGVRVRTRVYSSGGGYGGVGEGSAGEGEAEVEEAEAEAEARTSAAGVDNRDDIDDKDRDEAEFGTQFIAIANDQSMVEGEPCVCEPEVEPSSPAIEDDEPGQNAGDDEVEQTIRVDEDAGVERITVEAAEADATSEPSHHSGADSSECSIEDAGQNIDQDPRQTVEDLAMEQAAGDDENARGEPGAAEAEETDTAIDHSHHSCTDLSESLGKHSDQDNEQDAGQIDEEETGAVGDAEDADEADSAHLSTASLGLSSKDDGHDEEPFLTPEESSFDQIDQVVTAISDVTDDGPIATPADEQSLAEGSELGLIMPAIDSNHTASPTQQLVSFHQNAPPTIRRLSNPDARTRQTPAPDPVRRRASSMSDFQHLKTRLKLLPFAAKAAPADPAITACSVRIAESPRLNTVYEHPDPQYGFRPATGKGAATKTAQTVSSGRSTYQMVWEEPAPSEGSESDTTLIEPSQEPEDGDEESEGRSPSPMGKVKTKLAAWSWAREQQVEAEDSEGGSRPVLSLMRVDTDRRREKSEDHPYAPPNTEKHSASSSARHSGPQTPHEQPEVIAEEDDDVQQADDEAEVDEEDDQPMELRFKSAFHRIRSLSMPASTDYLTVPGRMLHSTSPSSPTAPHAPPGGLPRAMSNLAAEEARFMSHRDSLDLNHHRIEREARMNQLLMTTRDSFVLAKTKYEAKYPKTAGGIQYNRFGGLSTIPDASPPEEGREGFAALERRVEGGKRAVSEGAVKADGHIKWAGEKKVEKPRWYKARYMKGEGGVLNLVLLDEEVSE